MRSKSQFVCAIEPPSDFDGSFSAIGKVKDADPFELCSVQGVPALLRPSFVGEKLGFPPLQPSCSANSARLPLAQAELGRLHNIPDISKLNLGRSQTYCHTL